MEAVWTTPWARLVGGPSHILGAILRGVVNPLFAPGEACFPTPLSAGFWAPLWWPLFILLKGLFKVETGGDFFPVFHPPKTFSPQRGETPWG